MCNITLEDAYKEAVKKRYEEVKEGTNSNYLSSPTRAKLSNLCWEIFAAQNRHQDDLNAFNSLLELPFDLNTKNKFRTKIDKFRPIETFFKGETNPANIDFVNVAAILVDFQPRPFNKFRVKAENLNEKEIDNSENFDQGEKEDNKKVVLENDKIEAKVEPVSFFVNTKEKVIKGRNAKLWWTGLIIAVVFVSGFVISHYVFPKNQCMQWSHDHYEKVDCNLKTDGFLSASGVEAYDENKFCLKKIIVYDTTTCFKNGKAIIWYAKTSSDKADFFNTHGRHPENDKPLRPVTQYILNKYAEKSNSKK